MLGRKRKKQAEVATAPNEDMTALTGGELD